MRSWLLAGLVTVFGSACGAPPPQQPDLVLVVLDTVRADRLSAYGYDRPTTPHLDALAERAIRFDNAWSASSWTIPSHASLFTGLYPRDHGATQEKPRLGADLPTLAEILGTRGYVTIGVSANPLVGRITGLSRGFDYFEDAWRARDPDDSPESHPNVEASDRLLGQVPRSRPVFLFVNFMEAHSPYDPPPRHRERFLRGSPDEQQIAAARDLQPPAFYVDPAAVPAEALSLRSDLYDGEIAAVDEALGALLDLLAERRRLDRAFLVVTSDHGEAFGEHGHLGHVFNLYAVLTRIPLLIVPPGGGAGGVVRHDPASLVDVFATLVRQAGVDAPGPGRDLLDPTQLHDDHVVFSEYYRPLQALSNLGPALEEHPEVFEGFRRRLRAVATGSLHWIASSRGEEELYDLASDPLQQRDRSGDPRYAADAAELRSLLDRFARHAPEPDPGDAAGSLGDLDPATAERLRELGYLH
jgi:arylsulfatase A-like enzyme